MLIDGNYIDDREVETMQETIDLLYKVKRMPEVVFVLNIKNNEFDKMFKRVVDEDEIIKK